MRVLVIASFKNSSYILSFGLLQHPDVGPVNLLSSQYPGDFLCSNSESFDISSFMIIPSLSGPSFS